MMNRLIQIVSLSDGVLYSRNERVGNATGLVFDSETKVVYYMFNEAHTFVSPCTYSGYMAPYISENGKYCRFIDNQIVEIV